MANWIALTIDELKASEHGAIVDAAASTAIGASPDPVSRTITDVTAKLRAIISPGNVLDADPTKIPKSLVSLGARMCIRSLKQRIQMDLTVDERDQRREDDAYIQLLIKEQTSFEAADNPSGTAEMQQTGDRIEQLTGTTIDSQGGPAVPFGRQATSGLM